MRPGRQRVVLRSVFAAVALAGVLFLLLSQNEVPSVQGQRLDRVLRGMRAASAEARADDVNKAFRLLSGSGPDGLNWLAACLEHRETVFQKMHRRAWPHLPSVLQGHLPAPDATPGTLNGEIVQLVAAFGPPAARFFTNYLDESKYSLDTRQQAYFALANTRNGTSNTLAVLERKIGGTNLADRVFACSTLARLDPSSRQRTVTVLAGVLLSQTNATSNERLWAANALGNLWPEATNAVPALEQAAQDPDPFVRKTAVHSLRWLAKRARE